jgi:hypothetical protein
MDLWQLLLAPSYTVKSADLLFITSHCEPPSVVDRFYALPSKETHR